MSDAGSLTDWDATGGGADVVVFADKPRTFYYAMSRQTLHELRGIT